MDGRSSCLLLLFGLLSLVLLSKGEEVENPFQVVPMQYYMNVNFSIQSGKGNEHLKGQTISLWMGHPWSEKLPDLRLNSTDFVETDVDPKILMKCEQMLGFLNFRKSLYLMKAKTGNKVGNTAFCLILGYYDFDNPLNGTMNLALNDPRWSFCKKSYDSILDELICRDREEKKMSCEEIVYDDQSTIYTMTFRKINLI